MYYTDVLYMPIHVTVGILSEFLRVINHIYNTMYTYVTDYSHYCG